MGITALLLLLATEPCFQPIDGLLPLVAPRDGATNVPVNARIVVSGNVIADDVVITGPDGAIAATVSSLSVSSSAPISIFTPTAPLPAGTTVTVTEGDAALGTFDVIDLVDATAPEAPVVEVVGEYLGGSCLPMLELSAQTARPDASFAFFLVDDGGAKYQEQGEEDSFSSLAVDDVIAISGEAFATVAIAVVAVDLAGNVSPPTTVTGTFPEGAEGFRALGCFGCSSSGADAPLLVVGLVALRARRRRR